MLPFSESFEEQVRDALGCLYGFTELHDQPLAVQFASHLDGLPRVQLVRQLLIDSIQQLNTGRDSDFRSNQQRHYVLLQMRYVEEQSVQEVAQQLALGERQYYREHRKAVQALCYLLWQKLQAGESSQVSDGSSTRAEVQLAYSQIPSEFASLSEIAEGAVDAIRSLADKQRVIITLEGEEQEMSCWVNVPALRQVLILCLSHFLTLLKAGNEIVISSQHAEHHEIRVMVKTSDTSELGVHALDEHSVALNPLLKTLNAYMTLVADAPDAFTMVLALGTNNKTVLVIDDNPDAIRLIERYLANSRTQVAKASHADEGLRFALELKPDVIILDVMLPGRDGWEILQRLKSHPTTRDIPVVVCSVLDRSTAVLARSLGAEAYLHKPPRQIDFLRVLSQWGC